MGDFTFTSPEGRQFTVYGPEGSTKEQAFAKLQQQLTPPSTATGGGIGKFGSDVMTGSADIFRGAGQLAAHTFGSPETAQKVDLAMQKREQEIAAAGVNPLSRMIGNVGPGMAVGGPMGGMIGGAIGGGIGGAMQPVTGTGNYWSQKTDDMLYGAAFGAGATGALKTLGAGLSGVTDPAKRALIDSGVKLTPGQLIGGIARRAEEAFKSWPILGSMIRGAEGRGVEGFNRAVLNQSLEPFGATLPPGISAGPQAMKKTKELFDDAYTKALQGTKLTLDHDLADRLTDLRATAGELGTDIEKRFNTILDNRLSMLLRPGSQVPVKQAVGDIRALADTYRNSSQASERLLARRLDDVKQALTSAVARQNPQQADILRKVDYGYAMFARARAAATRRATSEQVFTPSDLLQAVKSQDKTAGHSKFSTGDSLLQVYAQYGQKVLPGKLPDSGTTERAMWDAAGLVYAREHPYLAAGMVGASAAYTQPAINAANVLARGVAKPVGSVVRRAAPYGGIAASNYAGQPTPDEPQYGGPQQ